MAKSCPVSFIQVDGNLARIGAFFVALFVVLFLITSEIFLLYILAIDFYIRIYGNKKYSLIFQLSMLVKKIFKIKKSLTDGAAKRLAAQFGLAFSIILIVEAQLSINVALYITASILLFCASLEFIFDYCVGCKVYYLTKRLSH
jgi:hypothetical protein